MFDFNLGLDLLAVIPFMTGWTFDRYDSKKEHLRAVLRGNIYGENVKETRKWFEFQEKQKKEAEKGLVSGFVGAIFGGVLGFFRGGPDGARVGWNAGKGIGQWIRSQDSDYFDSHKWLQGEDDLKGGMYNRTLDNLKWQQAVSDAKSYETMKDWDSFLNVGKGAFVGFQADWDSFNYKDWKDLTISDKWGEMIDSFKQYHMKDFKNAYNKQKDKLNAGSIFDEFSEDSDFRFFDYDAPEDLLNPNKIAESIGIPTEDTDVEVLIDQEIESFKKKITKDPGIIIPQMSNYKYDPNTKWATEINVSDNPIGSPMPNNIGKNDTAIFKDWWQNRQVRPVEQMNDLLYDLDDKFSTAWGNRPKRLQGLWDKFQNREKRPMQKWLDTIRGWDISDTASQIFDKDKAYFSGLGSGKEDTANIELPTIEDIEIPTIDRPAIGLSADDNFLYDEDINIMDSQLEKLDDFKGIPKAKTITSGGTKFGGRVDQETLDTLEDIKAVDKAIDTAVHVDKTGVIYKGILKETASNNDLKFNTVFKKARDLEVAVFWWRGKSYNTKRKGDTDYKFEL